MGKRVAFCVMSFRLYCKLKVEASTAFDVFLARLTNCRFAVKHGTKEEEAPTVLAASIYTIDRSSYTHADTSFVAFKTR